MLPGIVFGTLAVFRGTMRPEHPRDGDVVMESNGDLVAFHHGEWFLISAMPEQRDTTPRPSENCVSCGALVISTVCDHCGRRR